MGCFDFTYADNGQNIMGRRGYLYLTDAFCKETGLKSPIQFEGTDEYGRFDIRMPRLSSTLTIDIYAIYGAMLFLEGEYKSPNPNEENLFTEYIHLIKTYRKNKEFTNQELDDFVACEDKIRGIGIHYFFRGMQDNDNSIQYEVAKLGNQRHKKVTCEQKFIRKCPLVITRKKLPIKEQGESFFTTIQRWGFVSDSDPNQGFNATKNHYLPYKPQH